MLANVVLGLQLLGTAVGLWLGVGLIPIASLQILPYLAVGLFAAVDIHRRFPELGLPSLRDARLSAARQFARPSLHFLSLQLSSALSIQGTALIAGILLGSTQLVLFSTLRTMVNAIKSLLAILGHTAWPEMTRLDAIHDRVNLRRLFRALLRTTMVGSLGCVLILHFFGERVYSLWLKQAVGYQQEYLDLFLIYILQAVFWTACSQVLMAVNAHHGLSKTVLAATVVSVVLSLIGARIAGVGGIIVGLIAGDVLLPLWLVPVLLTRYEPSLRLGFYLQEGGLPLLAFALVYSLPISWVLVIPVLLLWWLQCLPRAASLAPWRFGRL
jgi:O-antigen/teichoic acid export membrane protein